MIRTADKSATVAPHLASLGIRRNVLFTADAEATPTELLTYALDPSGCAPADPARALARSIELDADLLGCAIRSGDLDQETVDMVLLRIGRQSAVVNELLRRRK